MALKGSDRYLVDGAHCRVDDEVRPVLNLSASGLFVASDTPLPTGQVVEIELALGDRAPFRVLGRITWVNDPLSGNAPHLPRGFGVQITRIALEDKLAILAALKQARALGARGAMPRTEPPG
jgi:hypothetical protein